MAIRYGGEDTFSIRIGWRSDISKPTSVRIVGPRVHRWGQPEPDPELLHLLYQGNAVESLELFDDGTHGDANAGDNVYTINELSTLSRGVGPTVEIRMWLDFEFDLDDGSTVQSHEQLPTPLRLYDASVAPASDVTVISSDAQKTEYVINLVPPDIMGTYPNQFFAYEHLIKNIPASGFFQRLYQLFPDDRDFVIIDRLIGTLHPATTGAFGDVGSSIPGIGSTGTPIASEELSSTGRLQGIINIFPVGHNFRTYNHEILHRWALYLPQIGLGHPHWPYPHDRGSSGFGHFAYSTIEQESDSTFRAFPPDEDRIYFNDFELYLMGLVPPDSVREPIRFLTGAEYLENTGTYKRWKADSLFEVTMQEVINFAGPRIPAYPESQTDFSLAMIVTYDRFLTSTELAFFDFLMRDYEKPSGVRYYTCQACGAPTTFEQATNGRATLTTKLSAPLTTDVMAEPFDKNLPNTDLYQNYPNPFNDITRITFTVAEHSEVTIKAYNSLGREVASLISGYFIPGEYEIEWDGESLASGLYFYRLESNHSVKTKSLTIIR